MTSTKPSLPTSFSGGRYQVKRLLGAGENWLGLVGDVERAEAVVAAAQGEYAKTG